MNTEHNSHSESVIETTAIDWMVEQATEPAKLAGIYGLEAKSVRTGRPAKGCVSNDDVDKPFVRIVAFSGLAECASANKAE